MMPKSTALAAALAALAVGTATPQEAAARHGGGRLAAGIALGIAGAAIIGGSRYYDGYYDDPYYYDSGYYGDGYYDDYGPRYRSYRHHRHYNGSSAFRRNYRGEASDD